jgi:preprotein translocase subunit SecG
MLMTFITILHVIACVFLILVVLLQTGKGAEMGAVFGGGGSQTIFGASGAGNLLTKLTTATAIVFFLTSLTLAWSSLARTRRTVFDESMPEPPPPAVTTPAASAPATQSSTSDAPPPPAPAPAPAPNAAAPDAPPPPAGQ